MTAGVGSRIYNYEINADRGAGNFPFSPWEQQQVEYLVNLNLNIVVAQNKRNKDAPASATADQLYASKNVARWEQSATMPNEKAFVSRIKASLAKLNIAPTSVVMGSVPEWQRSLTAGRTAAQQYNRGLTLQADATQQQQQLVDPLQPQVLPPVPPPDAGVQSQALPPIDYGAQVVTPQDQMRGAVVQPQMGDPFVNMSVSGMPMLVNDTIRVDDMAGGSLGVILEVYMVGDDIGLEDKVKERAGILSVLQGRSPSHRRPIEAKGFHGRMAGDKDGLCVIYAKIHPVTKRHAETVLQYFVSRGFRPGMDANSFQAQFGSR